MTNNHESANSGRSLLGGHLAGFTRWLEERGYATSTVEKYRVIGGRFDRYLTDHDIDIRHLDEGHLEAYLRQVEPLRPNGQQAVVAECYGRACRRLVEYLRERGATVARQQAAPGPAILRDYLSFLSDHRALARTSIKGHAHWVQHLFTHLGLQGEAVELRELSLSQIDGFLIATAGRLKRGSVGKVCAATRGFLRYLYLRDVLPRDLSELVATPRLYTHEDLPRALDWAHVERTLAAVDRKDLAGKRDYAILVVLAYCGLRAAEVAALRVDDMDWRQDTMRVRRGKSDTNDVLPLLPTVGGALVEYLQCRPLPTHREVFLRLHAPAGPLSGSSISKVAHRYLRAAGVEGALLGAHTLRHSFAVQLLRKGFPLKTIGDALGHRSPQSTFIYTKAPTEELRSVALEVTEVLE